MKKFALMIASAIVITPVARLDAAVINSTYVGPNGGNWNVAGNWSPVGVPNNGADTFNVLIDGTAALRGVNLNTNSTISELSINAGDSLTVNNGNALFILGPITNNSSLLLNSAGGDTYLRPSGGVLALNGTGTLVFSDNPSNWMYRSGATGSLLNGAGHTIRGAGHLGWNGTPTAITNQGTITAQGVNPLLVDLSGGVTNTSLMEANGGVLTLSSGTLNNVGGTLRAANNSTVQIANATVSGGTLETLGSGVIAASNNSSGLSGSVETVTLNGLLRITNGNALQASGTIVNNDTIEVASTGGDSYLRPVGGPLTLNGPGEVVFSDNTHNWMYRGDAVGSLINGTAHTIRGAGNFGWNGTPTNINNQGTVIAQGVNPLVVDLSGGLTNTGLMEANGGVMRLTGGTMTNTGGVLRAEDGSSVQISGGAIVSGGTFETLGSGVILANSGNSRISGPITLNGLLRVNNSDILFASGTINNNDTIEIASSGGATYLRPVGGPLTLSGTGELILADNANTWLYRGDAVGSLVNGSGHTIRGAGNFGWNASSLAVTNQGTIIAQGVNPMIVDLTGGITNNNLMKADGGTMRLVNGTLANTAGTLRAANGSTVEIGGGATVAGGIIDVQGSGIVVAASGNSRIDGSGSAITLNGLLRINDSSILIASGTINNNSTIQIGSGGGGATYFRPIGGVGFTLNGPGQLVMSDSTNSWVYRQDGISSLINSAGHTIRGAGNLGWSATPTSITNQGTVIAEGANPLLIDCTLASGFLNTGLLHVTGAGGAQLTGANFTNQGQVRIDATRTLTRNSTNYSQSAGTTTVNGTLTLPAALNVQLAGGVLNGNGTVAKLVNNTGGSIEPGTSAGQLNLGAGYTQAPGGTLKIEIGGGTPVTQHDVLAVTGNVILGGVLNVGLINGFVPAPGQKFTFLTHTGTRNGSFCSVTPKGTWDVIYTANSIQLVSMGTGCPFDTNSNGIVNVQDLLAIISAWGTCPNVCPTCYGDVSPIVGDGVVNVQDLLGVIGAWGARP